MTRHIDRHEHLARLLRDIRTRAELTQTESAWRAMGIAALNPSYLATLLHQPILPCSILA